MRRGRDNRNEEKEEGICRGGNCAEEERKDREIDNGWKEDKMEMKEEKQRKGGKDRERKGHREKGRREREMIFLLEWCSNILINLEITGTYQL